MAQNVYEGLFILDSSRYSRDPGGVSGKIPELIENCDGQILASRLWNEQKLAYAIKGRSKGTYWLTYFRMDSSQISALNRQCQLNETILRNLILKVDPRLSDTLVEHATGGSAVTRDRDQKEASAEPEVIDATADQKSGYDDGKGNG